MGYQYDDFKEKAYSALRRLAKESPSYADAQMLVGSADTTAHLARQFVRKSIDTEWVEHIEAALPARWGSSISVTQAAAISSPSRPLSRDSPRWALSAENTPENVLSIVAATSFLSSTR